jgi:uncharacterized Zn finger protein (UPF0148 family)
LREQATASDNEARIKRQSSENKRESSENKREISKNEHFFNASELYSKQWANEKLRFAIGTLQGKYEIGIWKRRLSTALIVKDELLEHGFTWQAARIENWIHRLEKQELAKDEIRLQHISADSQKSKREASF